jgi:hypothetical protein
VSDDAHGHWIGIIVGNRVRHLVGYYFSRCRVFVLVGMRVPPKHELLDDEKDAQSDHQRHADGVSAAGPHALHCFRQKPEQRSPDQCASCETHEVRQQAKAGPLGQQQEQPRERGARNAADRGEDDYPAKKGQGRTAFVTPSLSF